MQICVHCGEQNPGTYARCGYCGAEFAPGERALDLQRTVSIVFSDLKGSTTLGEQLDQESLVEVLGLYFDEMRLILESHGGVIEKIIGDAIFAVFGLGVPNGDDVLRAVSAAAECRHALSGLNEHLDRRWRVRLVNRTGVATGNVVVAAASGGDRLLIGEVVQLANKLEQAAPAMEILIDEATYQRLAHRITASPVDAIVPGDGCAPVPAYRLLSVGSAGEAQERAVQAVSSSPATGCSACGMQNPIAFRRCGACGAVLAAKRPRETRKTVTIAFADLKPTTAAGRPPPPDVLKDVVARAFEVSRRAAERHGGTVAKFIGDAIMAVFGLPVRREDDALRGVRAALDVKSALATLAASLQRERGLRLDVAIGVNTGEVAAGRASFGQSLVIGDAVNVAARLEQAASAGEILIGHLTQTLVRDVTDVEEIAALALKGKRQPVRAYRLLGVRSTGAARRRLDGAMVGREAEMALLANAFERTVIDRACRAATLVGDAGVGKTRLIDEFLESVADRVRVLRGRCLAYGEGITFWPIVGVVRHAADIQDVDHPDAAREKIRRLVGDGAVADRVAVAVGLLDAPFQVAELFWGIRVFFETLASREPLVVLFDDIHWAEPTFLDLIERLVETTRDVPVMLLCAARQELLEKRPSWGQGPNASRILLARLSDGDAARVIDNLLGRAGLPDRVRGRVIAAAEGNPLFVEQLVSVLIDGGLLRLVEGRWEPAGDVSAISIPPTIHALLAARLDQLSDGERAVIEPASVIGLTFAQAAVRALVEDDIRDEVPTQLVSLEQRQLVRRQSAAGDDALDHRFAHLMIRDTAYAGILKRARARLHERFVAWAAEAYRAADRMTEHEEILGYHLEQAHRYLAELGPLDEHGLELGIAASGRLASAGRRAYERGDMPATANLLRRAADALPQGHPSRPRLQYQLGLALHDTGQYEAAAAAFGESVAGAAALNDTGLETTAGLALFMKQYFVDPSKVEGRVEERIKAAIQVLERVADEEGLAQAWMAVANLRIMDNEWGGAAKAIENVIEHARKAGNRVLEIRMAPNLAMCAQYGATPVEEAIRICEQLVTRSGGDRRGEAIALRGLAHMHAMQGDFDSARDEYRRARLMLDELGWTFVAAIGSIVSGPIEMLAGDPVAAEAELRRDYETLDRLGERNYISTVAAYLAEALYRQRRYDEAGRFVAFVAEVAAPDDLLTQVLRRGVSAKLLAQQGALEEAERTAREAVDLIRRADEVIDDQANALMDLGEILRMEGEHHEAARVTSDALALYERKGNLVCAAVARTLVSERLERKAALAGPDPIETARPLPDALS